MYQSFYGFREKPFSLLPDSGFLYLSDKHRMALTLLEYGLMNQAGFTVISGGIGTGKTTLIRKLLNDIDPTIRVGLISNTHQTFGDLLQWIALAFGLPHQGRDKVQLYQEFMEFIIQEYAQGRRTVLIVDEAQNMPAETLEELRMLSNINADKDQVLQIILVGQRELRETLQRPDLVQFAQRIGVDYHLEPLEEAETSEYIRHRCKTAGGKAELFSDQACHLIHRYSGGVPRLINLLCDTALVYGYAEQRDRVDAALVEEVAKEKQQGGLFPAQHESPEAVTQASPNTVVSADVTPVKPAQEPVSAAPVDTGKKSGRLRIAITAESELLRIYLSRLLSRFAIEVIATLPLTAHDLRQLPAGDIDVLLVELDDNMNHLDEALYEILEEWQRPVLFNDSLATEASLSQPNRHEYGRKLSEKLFSLVPQAPQSVA
ncbi:MAG TPA: DUF2075 domain-containing protein [Gammaproteobacteria bacterium]|nr:DUF2075 domain-containing protein [Gammaproteobacteria bacterium]